MKKIFLVLSIILFTRCYSADKYDEMIIEWNDFRTYLARNDDFTNYRVATYSKKTQELLIYYQGDVIENSERQIYINSKGAAMWGPASKNKGGAESIWIQKAMQTAFFYNGINIEPKQGAVVQLAGFAEDVTMIAIRNGLPPVKY